MYMSKVEIVEAVIAITEKLTGSENFKSTMFGNYSDGTPRSLPDALNEEVLSPKQKVKELNKKKKKKDKKKQKKKRTKLKL